MRVICTASANASPFSCIPEAIIQTTIGAATMPITVMANKVTNKTKATWSSNVFTSCWLRVSFCSPKMGTNAWEKAPSANNRRSKLGIRKATQNASVKGLAPKVRAIKISRIRPVIRDKRVKPLTVTAERNRLIDRSMNLMKNARHTRSCRAPCWSAN